MFVKSGRSLILVGAILTGASLSASAQDFFREYGTSRSSGGIGPVSPSEYSYQDISPTGLAPLDPIEVENATKDHNFAIGPVRFSMAVGVGVEFNDNITYSENNRISDIIIRPVATLDANWTISETNVLRFSLGVSYAKFLDNSQFDTDGILISPNSALEYTFGLGPAVKVALRGRFSYQEDPFDIANLSAVARYQRYETQVGAEAEWDINANVRVNFGYDHYNLWAKNDFFRDQDRAIDTIFVKPSYALTQTLRIGVNASYSLINFESDNRSDGHSLMFGPYVSWDISDATNAFLEVGYQQLAFDGSYQPEEIVERFLDQQDLDLDGEDFVRDAFTDDSQDSNSYYVRFEVNNKPTEFFKHRISGSKTAEIGFFTQQYDLYHVEYSFDWAAVRKTEISPTVFYEYYETSGQIGEEAHRMGAALGVRHYLTNSVTLGLDYRFLYKDSNLETFDYYQNLAFLSVYYKF